MFKNKIKKFALSFPATQNAVVTFIGSFAKGRQKNAVHCDTRQNVQKKSLRRAKTVTHSQKAKENPRKRGFS